MRIDNGSINYDSPASVAPSAFWASSSLPLGDFGLDPTSAGFVFDSWGDEMSVEATSSRPSPDASRSSSALRDVSHVQASTSQRPLT